MAGEENFIGMVRVQAKLGCFAAGSSPDLIPSEIENKYKVFYNSMVKEKKRFDHEAHGDLTMDQGMKRL